MTSRNSKGFTLVELLIVLALIGILMMIAMPALIGQIAHIRLSRSAREVSVMLNAARLKAISKNVKYEVSFALNPGQPTTPDTYSLLYWNGTAFQTDTNQAQLSLAYKIKLTSINGGASGSSYNVIYYPNGISSNADNWTATNSALCIGNTAASNDKMQVNVTGATGMITIANGCS